MPPMALEVKKVKVSPAVKAMGTELEVDGYIIPLVASWHKNHFMLSKFSERCVFLRQKAGPKPPYRSSWQEVKIPIRMKK